MSNPFDDDLYDKVFSKEEKDVYKPEKYAYKPDCNNKDDDDTDDDDEALIMKALDDMDIDNDFQCWKSFRSSVSIKSSVTHRNTDTSSDFIKANNPLLEEKEEMLSEHDKDRIRYWNNRILRNEVYSYEYKPVPREERELRTLADFLNVPTNSTNDANSAASVLFGMDAQKESSRRSIVLKRGPVLYNGDERELILLTHGYVLAKVNKTNTDDDRDIPPPPSSSPSPHSGGSSKRTKRLSPISPGKLLRAPKNVLGSLTKKLSFADKIIRRTYECCNLYTDVKCIHNATVSSANESSTLFNEYKFVVEDFNGNKYEFQCETKHHLQSWLHSLARVVTEAYRNALDNDITDKFGWQYQILTYALCSPIVCSSISSDIACTPTSSDTDSLMVKKLNDMLLLKNKHNTFSTMISGNINDLDTYNGMAPLHYATIFKNNQCIKILVEKGNADVNLRDVHNCTPMFYAQQEARGDDNDIIVQLLRNYGAVLLTHKEMEQHQRQRNDVFEGRSRRSCEDDTIKKKKMQLTQAKENRALMQENYNALNERGERLEEMATKTKDLENEAKTFNQLAKQLKEKSEQQNRRWGF